MPAVVTLDDLAAMNDADQHGHRYELSPEGALWVMPQPDSEHAVIASRLSFAEAGILRYWVVDQDPAQTVTMYELGPDAYVERAKMPLSWLLNTSPADHLG